MYIHFPDDVDPAVAAKLVRSGMADVDVTEDFLTAVIVADDFATAVAAALGRPETLTAGLDFGGKAVPVRSDDGVRTSVLIPGGMFRQLIAEAAHSGGRRSDHAKMVHYALRHEFGHAKDFRLRGVTGIPGFDKDLPFRVTDVASHELTNVLQEFFACAHSARSLTQADFSLIGANE